MNNMIPGRHSYQCEFLPIPCCGPVLVYMIPPQNAIPSESYRWKFTLVAVLERDFHSHTKIKPANNSQTSDICPANFWFWPAKACRGRGNRFYSLTASLSNSGVPRLQEKPLVVVGDTAFEDLGVSWVDVVIRGLSIRKDFRITPTFITHTELLIMYALYCFWRQ